MIPGRRALAGALVALSLFAAAVPALAQPAQGDTLAGRALVEALRRGGHVIYFRHTSTDFGQNDEGMTSYDDCKRQRNLTDAGRDEARRIGADIKRLGIPVGDVLASPFCRTVETGMLIFGRATPTQAVRGGPASTDDPDRYAALKKLLATTPPKGTNTAISSHGNPFRAVAGSPYLAEGEAAIVEPLAAQGFRVVARVTKDGWSRLED